MGLCANPIQAGADDPDRGRRVPVLIRCGNRRTAIYSSCSHLYAADAWQLVHAGRARCTPRMAGVSNHRVGVGLSGVGTFLLVFGQQEGQPAHWQPWTWDRRRLRVCVGVRSRRGRPR